MKSHAKPQSRKEVSQKLRAFAPLRETLRLAKRGFGATSPNPMVGAVLVKSGKIIGRGWHRRAGLPHAEIEALRDAQKRGHDSTGATLCVTLELNETFNHWIVNCTPFVTVKAAMTLDGKIATATGESKWITGEKARAHGMNLRQGSDAILVGVNTILADDPSLSFRPAGNIQHSTFNARHPKLRRIVLDSRARTPLTAKVVSDELAALTTIVVSKHAPKNRVAALAKRVKVLVAPLKKSAIRNPQSAIDLRWLLQKLGAENVTSLLVEGGGEVNASFLLGGLAQRVAFSNASATGSTGSWPRRRIPRRSPANNPVFPARARASSAQGPGSSPMERGDRAGLSAGASSCKLRRERRTPTRR